jgi:hypothetical protein
MRLASDSSLGGVGEMEHAIVPRRGVSLRTFTHVAVIIGHVCEHGCLHACTQCLLRSRKELGMTTETQDVSVQPVDT